MKVHICHIRTDRCINNNVRSNNHYSVWASKKQALDEASKFIRNELGNSYSDVTKQLIPSLYNAIIFLLDNDNIKLAIQLLNDHTHASGSSLNSKTDALRISVEEVDFKRSPLE